MPLSPAGSIGAAEPGAGRAHAAPAPARPSRRGQLQHEPPELGHGQLGSERLELIARWRHGDERCRLARAVPLVHCPQRPARGGQRHGDLRLPPRRGGQAPRPRCGWMREQGGRRGRSMGLGADASLLLCDYRRDGMPLHAISIGIVAAQAHSAPRRLAARARSATDPHLAGKQQQLLGFRYFFF